MQCAVASGGVLKIGRVGVGVGVILHGPAKKMAVGVHVLAPNSVSPTPDNRAKYGNTAIPDALGQLKAQGVGPPLSFNAPRRASLPVMLPVVSAPTKQPLVSWIRLYPCEISVPEQSGLCDGELLSMFPARMEFATWTV